MWQTIGDREWKRSNITASTVGTLEPCSRTIITRAATVMIFAVLPIDERSSSPALIRPPLCEPQGTLNLSSDSSEEVSILHGPHTRTRCNNKTTTPQVSNAPKSEDASYLVSFSATLSEEVDEFVLSQAPTYNSHELQGCLYHCGMAMNCFDANNILNTTNSVATSSLESSSASRNRRQYEALRINEDPASFFAPPLTDHELRSPPRCAPISTVDSALLHVEDDLQAPRILTTTMIEDDPIMQARHLAGDAKRVRFGHCVAVHEFTIEPVDSLSELFWSDRENIELRQDRRVLLQQVKQHILYSPLLAWTEESESM